jgi:hypothetical protein
MEDARITLDIAAADRRRDKRDKAIFLQLLVRSTSYFGFAPSSGSTNKRAAPRLRANNRSVPCCMRR